MSIASNLSGIAFAQSKTTSQKIAFPKSVFWVGIPKLITSVRLEFLAAARSIPYFKDTVFGVLPRHQVELKDFSPSFFKEDGSYIEEYTSKNLTLSMYQRCELMAVFIAQRMLQRTLSTRKPSTHLEQGDLLFEQTVSGVFVLSRQPVLAARRVHQRARILY